MEPVGQDEQAGAELGEQLAGVPVVLEDRIDVRVLFATAGQGVRPAAVVDPDMAVRVDVHTRGGTPGPSVREIGPLGDDRRVRVRQVPLDEVGVSRRLFHFGGHVAATAKDGERQAARQQEDFHVAHGAAP